MRLPTFICLLLLSACAGRSPTVSAPARAPRLEVQGHRGCRGLRPENTLPAFEHAIRLGVDVLELDLALSRDGVLVVVHDPEVNPAICVERRPLPSRRYRDLTWAEIQTLDCGSKRNPRFPEQVPVPGTRPPRLEEVLDLLQRHERLRANIELKTFADRRELTRPPADFARALAPLLRRRGLGERVVVQSFDAEALRAVAALDAGLTRAALCETAAAIEPMLGLEGIRIYSPLHRLIVDAAGVRAMQARGLRVVPWTVNERSDMQRLIDWGVDGLITDYPDRLLALLRSSGG